MRASEFEVDEEKEDVETVLVVDDEEGPRQALRLVLEPHFRVVTAASGEEALTHVATGGIDLVTLDLRLTGADGIETLARIRDLDAELPVVIVTGAGTYESARESLRLRAFDYLTKPFDGMEVLAVIDRAHRASQERRRRHAADRLQQLADDLYERVVTLTAAPVFRSEGPRLRAEHLRLLARSVRNRLEKNGAMYLAGLVQQLDALRAAPPAAFGRDEQARLNEAWAIARTLRAGISMAREAA